MRSVLEGLETRRLLAGVPAYEPLVTYNTGVGANTTVVTGDFNGDGALDIAVSAQAGDFAGKIAILLNNRAGGFAAPTYINAPNANGAGAAAADLNGDNRADLLYLRSDGVGVLLSSGASFAPASLVPMANPTSIAVGDFNADGRADFAAGVSIPPHPIMVALGNGAGGFSAPTPFGAFAAPAKPVAGDFDGDGNLDLLVLQPNQLVLLTGNGNGTFLPGPVSFIPFGAAYNIAVADLDGQRGLDVVINARIGLTELSFIGFNDSFGFQTLIPGNLGLSPQLADLDGDGDIDVISTDPTFPAGPVLLHLNVGTGFFAPPITLLPPGSAFNSAVAVADLNNDGILDIITAAGAGSPAVGPTGVGVLLSPNASPLARLQKLMADFDAYLATGALNKGNAHALDIRLDSTLDRLEAGDSNAAVKKLELFIKLADNLSKKAPGLLGLIADAKDLMQLLK